MVNQLGTPTPLHNCQLPGTIKSEPYSIHHIMHPPPKNPLLLSLALRCRTFQILTVVHLISHLIDHPVIRLQELLHGFSGFSPLKGTGTLMTMLYKENGKTCDTYITAMRVLPMPQCSVRMWAGIPHA